MKRGIYTVVDTPPSREGNTTDALIAELERARDVMIAREGLNPTPERMAYWSRSSDPDLAWTGKLWFHIRNLKDHRQAGRMDDALYCMAHAVSIYRQIEANSHWYKRYTQDKANKAREAAAANRVESLRQYLAEHDLDPGASRADRSIAWDWYQPEFERGRDTFRADLKTLGYRLK